ncbi:hypothetical protein CFU_4326 [Collimonas fungivorans Ter331]|uniref:Uncharacterized protein n=1 Tax=Collimonas fungivorans (strain Ter331) TaxID=1005048 RepID=G0AFQ8_COLFT|nr:hypothetical protein CFU_4326 [Collimonas fungivorans Ter331]
MRLPASAFAGNADMAIASDAASQSNARSKVVFIPELSYVDNVARSDLVFDK